ncbi:MAG TPA: hypothetical protein VKT73_11100 [Xanthobacteraceae bacterium]|nr:hypothetical protein [Xanthobacteraceae bacterium]
MFGFELPHLILIPPPWNLLMVGLLPFFIVAMLLPNNFLMPKNDDGDFYGSDDEDKESLVPRPADKPAKTTKFSWSTYEGAKRKDRN